jgi:hypothetical protein
LSEYGIEFKPDVFKNYPPYNTDTDIISANLVHLNDLDTMNVGSDLGTILSVEAAMQTGFTLLKEKSGSIFCRNIQHVSNPVNFILRAGSLADFCRHLAII